MLDIAGQTAKQNFREPQRNSIFATNSNFLILLSLQHHGVDVPLIFQT